MCRGKNEYVIKLPLRKGRRAATGGPRGLGPLVLFVASESLLWALSCVERRREKKEGDKVKSRNIHRESKKWSERRKKRNEKVFFPCFFVGEFDIHAPFLIGNKAPL